MKDNIIREKSYSFALDIIKLYLSLQKKKEYVISGQLLRAGTSIGANVEEALAGQSRRDFAAKMAIASKEAREAHYWLRLIRDSGLLDGLQLEHVSREALQIGRILTAIVKTSMDESKERAASS